LQEYQSKKLLEANGVNIQRFQMASTPKEAYEAGTNLSKYFQFFLFLGINYL